MSLYYLIKPSVETKFYIDYEWWDSSRDDLHVYLLTHLTNEQRSRLDNCDLHEVFDYIDPVTGEVFQLDQLDVALRESSGRDDFITEHIGLIDSVFRALLVNGNRPLNALELSKITARAPETILKTIGGMRVYRGIRPYHLSSGAKA